MRLIDADNFKQTITEVGERRGDPWQAKLICDLIDVQPTVKTYDGWLPAGNSLPKVNEDGESEYVLLSFSNFPLPTIGLYWKDSDDSGAYYDGDEDKPLCSYGLFVNAWMPLPEPYKEGENCGGRKRRHDKE